jgi:dephospho-CoA kinase
VEAFHLHINAFLKDNAEWRMKMFLLQMAGYPGSGKSTLSKKIAKTTGAIVIDRDVIKSSLIVSDVPEELLAPAAHNVLFDRRLRRLGFADRRNIIL